MSPLRRSARIAAKKEAKTVQLAVQLAVKGKDQYRYDLAVAWGALLGDAPRAIVLLVPDLEGVDPLHLLWVGFLVGGLAHANQKVFVLDGGFVGFVGV
jgi:hypothetical protein